jgi:hypothetical protein
VSTGLLGVAVISELIIANSREKFVSHSNDM